jgi:hypothetical protein
MLLIEKHLEDLLKELYLEAERSNQPLILGIQKRMYKKLI